MFIAISLIPIRNLPFAPDYVACRFRGGKYRYRNGAWQCIIEDENDEADKPTDPPANNDSGGGGVGGNENPPRTDEDREDTDDDTTQPDPPPLPVPPLPPTRNPDPRDNPDRKPIPVADPEPRSTLPKIPRRRLPSLERPESNDSLLIFQNPVIGVEESAFERTYGCLLHNPITSSPIVIRQCESPDNLQENQKDKQIQEQKDFFDFLIRKTAQTATGFALHGACVLTVNLLPTRFIRYVPNSELAINFGCSLLSSLASSFIFESSNALQSIDGNGHINVKYVDCTPEDDGEDAQDLTQGLGAKFDNIGECFVPVRNFKENEPNQTGMKRQLQVVYEKVIEQENDAGETINNRVQKQITLPNPLPLENDSPDPTAKSLTEDAIKNVFPETLEFGEVKTEMDIIPYGYVRFYSTSENTEGSKFETSATDKLFDDILTLIDGTEVTKTIEGEEVKSSRRYSRRKRNIITGEFNRKKAFLFEWKQGDGKPPLCKTFNL